MRIKIDWFNFLILISIFLSVITNILFFGNAHDGYQLMLIYPLIYLFVYLLILQDLRNSKYSFVSYGIILMQWIRFVLMPSVILMAGDNPGMTYINPATESLYFATLLIIYEFIITSSFARYWIPLNNNKIINNQTFFLGGNKLVYILFILVGILLAMTIGLNNNLLSFFIIPLSGEGRRGDVTNTYLTLVVQIIKLTLFFSFLMAVNRSKKKYQSNPQSKYIYLPLLFALINVAFIIGERRTAQVYTALLTIWILIKAFPNHKKRVITIIGSFAFAVLTMMSVYKFFGAFLYESYGEAISNSSLDFEWLSRTLQSYFFGPENLAITLEFSNSINLDLTNLIYDFARSAFGLSFFLKGENLLTSYMFNTFVYGVPTATGHLLSAAGYGYIYFGPLLAPLIAVLNIMLAVKAEQLMKNTRYLEMMYVWGYVLVRFSTNLFVNTAPLISASTIMIGTGGLLFFVAVILNRTNKRKQTLNYF